MRSSLLQSKPDNIERPLHNFRINHLLTTKLLYATTSLISTI